MNLAIGGDFGGNPDATTIFPGEMQVDYVRVYEMVPTETLPRSPSKSEPAHTQSRTD